MLESVWAIVLTLSGTFGQLVDYVSFGDWIFFGLTVAGLYRLRALDARRGAPVPPRGVLVPGYPWTPAVFIAASALVVASAVLGNPANAAVGTGLLLLGIPVYLWWRRPRWAQRARRCGARARRVGSTVGTGVSLEGIECHSVGKTCGPRSSGRGMSTGARSSPITRTPTLRAGRRPAT